MSSASLPRRQGGGYPGGLVLGQSLATRRDASAPYTDRRVFSGPEGYNRLSFRAFSLVFRFGVELLRFRA